MTELYRGAGPHYNDAMLLETRRIRQENRHIVLLGTGVVTPDALDALDEAIREHSPDHVVLDYDETRWRWLQLLQGDGEVDLVDVIKSGEMAELNSRLAMGVIAKYVSPRSGVALDAEFKRAYSVADELGLTAVFGRRPVEVEGVRAWRYCGVGQRFGFAWNLLKGSLRRSQLSDATAAEDFDDQAARASGTQCAGGAAGVLFDEALLWLADIVNRLEGEVVIVTRLADFDLLESALREDADVSGFEFVPDKSLFSRCVPWVFTGLIIAAFVLGFVFADPEKMQQAAVAWFISNMSFAALGALLALAHPVTIVATSLSAPFVSLNPAIGAGMVGALVQAFVAPPSVQDMDRVGDDITQLAGWWRNRLARLVLIFIFANAFSSIGSIVALAWFPTG